jgi:diguanylate cyclase (GGDEF)-like protein
LADYDGTLNDLLSRFGRHERLDSGQELWREGDPGDEVVLLLEGSLEVTSNSADGHLIVLRELRRGTVLGEIACLDGHPRSAGVRTSAECLLARCPAGTFRELLHGRPDILESLLLQQVELVRKLTTQVTHNHHRAITDPLTRLYNVAFFNERLGLELDRAGKTGDHVAVVMFDLDHFKHYNDTHGHQVGNDALTQVAEILRSAGRRGDIVARYGGEEFVVLLYGANRGEAIRFAEAVRNRIERTRFVGGADQPKGCVTISGGAASFPADARDQNRLIFVADRNLYRAKQAGRNRIEG